MAITSVLTSLATAAVVQVYHAINQTDTLSTAQTQINAAFGRLDKEVRYARGISDPAVVGSDWYVEYLFSVSGVNTCVELRVNASASSLQRREWVSGASSPVPSPWVTLATGITASAPFTVTDPDTNSVTGARYQRLTVAMTSTAGVGRADTSTTGKAGAVRETNVTFTALNATAPESSSTCTEARGVSS
jgi:hypothetical protein